ncbi:ATP-dependent helicase [Bacillus ndiopicus]|uniref:ATP-dependent helicase n=1 Tax=Bacillus ndiopicus TaxID=1347368 RepID=UPI0005AA92DB|nr:ATP-dependent helicase [Bacillus ndiopicus]
MNEGFFERKKKELGVALNDKQKAAVLSNEGPLLILASPGSGKTTTIIMKIGYLIEIKGVNPARIKAVTFSRASANDMKERFKKFFPKLPQVDFSTIHSLAYKIVQEHFRNLNISYQLIEGSDSDRYLNKRTILRNIYKQVNNERITEDKLEELITSISYIKNKLLPKEQWLEFQSIIPKFSLIVDRYKHIKESNRMQLLLDYDDMLIIANNALQQNPSLLAKYQGSFDFVLTDESQDTSLVQHKIIEQLVQRHKNLCVVADDDQSIYGWRGAEPQYLLDFKNVYPTAKIIFMEQNYRSSKNIVATANEFIKQNNKRYHKNMFTENPESRPIVFKQLMNSSLQPKHLALEVKHLNDFKNTAILYRNNISSIVLIDYFEREGIPFYMKDSDNLFFNHWLVEDVLNFMRLSFDLRRIDIFEKIYTKFGGYFSREQLEKLRRIPGDESVFDKLLQLPNLQNYQKPYIEGYKKSYEKIKTCTIKEVIRIIRKELGLDSVIENGSKRFGYNADSLFDILNTLAMIAESTSTMKEFAERLKYLDAVMKESKKYRGKNAVTFSTFHSSKGLEFENVYMIDLIDGVIPSVFPKDDDKSEDWKEEREEEVRLFYVGMTRAIHNLQLVTYSRKFEKNVDASQFWKHVKRIVNQSIKHTEQYRIPSTQYKVSKPKEHKRNNPNALKDKNLLKNGTIIKHHVFGNGKIISCDTETIEIQFSQNIKKLQIAICIEHGLIELVE